MKNLVVVNLFAGPGAGKSTTAAGVFSELKFRGINCELSSEYAKDKVWEESTKVLTNQVYVFGKQHHRLNRLADQVDIVVTDAPLLIASVYASPELPRCFHELVLHEFNQFKNVNFFLSRTKPYNPKGRVQTEDKAKGLDVTVKTMLETLKVDFTHLTANRDAVNIIADAAVAAFEGRAEQQLKKAVIDEVGTQITTEASSAARNFLAK